MIRQEVNGREVGPSGNLLSPGEIMNVPTVLL